MEGMGKYTFRASKTFTISFCTGGGWLISWVGKEGSCPHILVGHQPMPWNSVHVHMFFQSELALVSVVEGGQRRGLTLELTRVASWGPGKPCAWCMLLGCESEEDCVAGRSFLQVAREGSSTVLRGQAVLSDHVGQILAGAPSGYVA